MSAQPAHFEETAAGYRMPASDTSPGNTFAEAIVVRCSFSVGGSLAPRRRNPRDIRD